LDAWAAVYSKEALAGHNLKEKPSKKVNFGQTLHSRHFSDVLGPHKWIWRSAAGRVFENPDFEANHAHRGQKNAEN
jgi:hypothetical protein